jgi:murein L,D-transpeptidase YcbB/YkuD
VELNSARKGTLASRSSLRRYAEVNLPAFELHLVQYGTVVLRSRVIFGDEKTPTPISEDVISYIDLDPVWYVPPSIVKELLDHEKRTPPLAGVGRTRLAEPRGRSAQARSDAGP